ncbi:MAG: hypothetical protein ACXVHW_06780, partial [Methanobacterium sp.]
LKADLKREEYYLSLFYCYIHNLREKILALWYLCFQGKNNYFYQEGDVLHWCNKFYKNENVHLKS